MLLGEFDRLGEHARPFFRGGRQDDSGTEKAHQLASLDAKVLGHGDDQRITLLGADHGEADAGVPAGRLDHGLAWF